MARFLALFASSNVTLLDPFCGIFCLLEERSMAGPWAFVLNISSNSSTFKSWGREDKWITLKKSVEKPPLRQLLQRQRTHFFYSIFVFDHSRLYLPICVYMWLVPHVRMWTSKGDNWSHQPIQIISLQGRPPQTKIIHQTSQWVWLLSPYSLII